jgi:cyclin E
MNKLNLEMILTKHSSSTYFNKENHHDIPWYHSHSLWSNMMIKTLDETYKCRFNFLESHSLITTKMRSVLFDWLIEVKSFSLLKNERNNLLFFLKVCEVYHLHRETYHLSIVYIDQYLSNKTNLAKNKLQLLGITALFVASKIEVKRNKFKSFFLRSIFLGNLSTTFI